MFQIVATTETTAALIGTTRDAGEAGRIAMPLASPTTQVFIFTNGRPFVTMGGPRAPQMITGPRRQEAAR